MSQLKARTALDMIVWGKRYPHIKPKEWLQIKRVHGENYKESDIPTYLRKRKLHEQKHEPSN